MFLGLNLRNVGLVGAIASAFAGLKQTFTTGGTTSLGNAAPVGAKTLRAVAWGGGGGGTTDGAAALADGGASAYVVATFTLGVGYTFDYWVGVAGNVAPFNGGGVSAIRLKSADGSTVGWVIAPGGGGAGSPNNNNSRRGGNGGAATLGDGENQFGFGGTHATSSAGGTGGVGTDNGSDGSGPFTTSQVSNGGVGGNFEFPGGAGGDGYYGGGGGGGASDFSDGAGGGGGGSSFATGYVTTSGADGSGTTPGGTSDPDYAAPAGQGGIGGGSAAGAGRLVLIWS